MRLLMKCQHEIEVDVDQQPTPTCHCGERQVARALNPPRPRFVGHARGPLVEGRHLGAKPLDLTQPVVGHDGAVTTAGPLRLKPDTVRTPNHA